MAKLPKLYNPFSPLWKLPAFHITEDPRLEAEKRAQITQVSGGALAALGPIFATLNLLNGLYGLALINVITSVIGALAVFLARRGRAYISALLLSYPLPPVIFISALLYRNGMEYILLLNMMAAIFMFNRPIVRVPLGLMIGAGFVVVKILHFTPLTPGMPLGRYATNLTVFLFSYYWILEVFRAINIRYQIAAEEKNQHLQNLTQELERANAAKEKIFRIVAHDLRGPLGNLQSTVQLVSDGDMPPEDFQSLLPQVQSELDNASHCLGTLLHWSSGQLSQIQPVIRPVALDKVWREMSEVMGDGFSRKRVTLSGDIPREAVVECDENLLEIILRNLLSNALKFTPEHGQVTLKAERDGTEIWRLSVNDTGIGIPAERLDEILSPTPPASTRGTDNERGLGLGLRICQDLLHALGSRLSVSSDGSQGSSFYFPLRGASRTQSPMAAS